MYCTLWLGYIICSTVDFKKAKLSKRAWPNQLSPLNLGLDISYRERERLKAQGELDGRSSQLLAWKWRGPRGRKCRQPLGTVRTAGWQPVRRWGPQVCNHKELNFSGITRSNWIWPSPLQNRFLPSFCRKECSQPHWHLTSHSVPRFLNSRTVS